MTLEQAQNTLRQRFKAQIVDTANPVLPVAYDNVPFEQPDEGLWARVTIKPGMSEQVSVGAPGSNRFRTSGVMIVQCFIDEGAGDQPAVALADKVAGAFRSATIGGIVYQTPAIEQIGVRDKWYQVNVTVNFYFDHIS